MAQKLYCPTDENVVLYVEADEDKNVMKYVIPEPPKTCQICGKSYYKWECVARSEDEDDEW